MKYFRDYPPRKQIVANGSPDWSEPQQYDGKEPLLVWLLRMIRCVRNNLFHGGKYPLIPISEPARNRDLLVNSLVILTAALSLDGDVETLFFHDL